MKWVRRNNGEVSARVVSEKAVGRVRESVGVAKVLAEGLPGGLRVPRVGPGVAWGRNAILLHRVFRNRLSVARTSDMLYPTVHGLCQKQTLHTRLSTNIME